MGIHNAPREDSDQTARMHGLIWILAGCQFSKVRFLTSLFIRFGIIYRSYLLE